MMSSIKNNSCLRCGNFVVKGPLCLSCATKKRYEDPEQRQLTSRRAKEAWSNPGIRERQICAIREACVGGKHITENARRNQSIAATKNMTPERRERISLEQRKRWEDPDYRENHSRKTKEAWANGAYDGRDSEEYRAKLSRALKRAHAEGKFDDAERLDYYVSSLEKEVAYILDQIAFNYRQQYRPKDCSYCYDFFLPDWNLLLEVDGEYWHHSENAIKFGMVERDKLKSQWATDNGYAIERIRERDILKFGTAEMISRLLNRRESWQHTIADS